MNRIILIGAFLILGVLFLVFLIFSPTKPRKNFIQNTPNQTNQPLRKNQEPLTQEDLKIVSTNPEDRSTGIPLDQIITVNFNRLLLPEEVNFVIGPSVDFSIKIDGNKITSTPTKPLLSGSTYTFLVKFKQKDLISPPSSFTTIGIKPKFLPDTQDPNLKKDSDQFTKINSPDIFLANNTPFENDDFKIVRSGTHSSPTEHYFFTIIYKRPNGNVKTAVEKWLLTLGLNSDQITSLDIEY